MGKTTIQPTIMSGSNSNVNWVKFADGTLIQYGVVTFNNNKAMSFDLPISFTNTAYAVGATYNNSGTEVYPISIWKETKDTLWLYTTTNISRPVNWVAIGRWK